MCGFRADFIKHEALTRSVYGEMVMLQPVDVAVAFDAAHRQNRFGKWSPKDIRVDLGIAWSSLNLSLGRLDELNVLRRGRVHRGALATLLPALPDPPE